MMTFSLKEMVERLPPDLVDEAKNYIEYLLQRYENRPRGKPTFDWGGALKGLKEQYTSVQLQHEIADWRTGK